MYKGLVVETEYDSRSYVLSEGEWYVVAKTLSDSVRTFMEQFETATINLPAAAADEDERKYNERAAKELDWVLTDRQTVKPAGARTPLEFSDLLSPSNHIVHVKPRTSSSTLSHLFGQAFASAEAFLYDGKFREQLRGKLGARVFDLIPVDPPKPQEYEITFAIIGGTAKDWPHSLPFLSIPGKTSQAIQFDESSAAELKRLIEETFPSLRLTRASGEQLVTALLHGPRTFACSRMRLMPPR